MARITKTLQLVEGVDDDLIAWFESLSKGDGQRILKDTLRNGINCKPGDKPKAEPTKPQPPAPAIDPDLKDTFTTLATSISDLVQTLKENTSISIYSNSKRTTARKPKEKRLTTDELALRTADPQATREAAMNVVNMFG